MATAGRFGVIVRSLLADGLRVRFRAGGRSMQPTVRDGECVVVAPVDPGEVGPGDVLLCETWRGHLAHRVLSVDGGADGARRFTLRGDASFEADRPVAASSVCGRLLSVESGGRTRGLAFRGGALERRLHHVRLELRRVLALGHAWLPPGRASSLTP